MSLEHAPIRTASGAVVSGAPDDPEYWNVLVNEKAAGDFLGVTVRAMQKMRQTGDGPRFIRLSSRCIRYTRALLKSYADARMRSSTSDTGEA